MEIYQKSNFEYLRWTAGRSRLLLHSPRASCRYFCPTSLRYSSIAFVANVFSLKMRCSFSPQRSTSDIIKSVRKSCRKRQKQESTTSPVILGDYLHLRNKQMSVDLLWELNVEFEQRFLVFGKKMQRRQSVTVKINSILWTELVVDVNTVNINEGVIFSIILSILHCYSPPVQQWSSVCFAPHNDHPQSNILTVLD